jgi:predicted acetyltransferase
MENTTVTVCAFDELNPLVREQIWQVQARAFGFDNSSENSAGENSEAQSKGEEKKEESERPTEWTDESGWHVYVSVGEVEGDAKVVSVLDLYYRQATAGGQKVILGGVGGVATLPEEQRKGYAGLALREAARFMCLDMGVDFGLLVCSEEKSLYYSKFGWQRVPGPLKFSQSYGETTVEWPVMVLPCKNDAWPPGVIDLCGKPW